MKKIFFILIILSSLCVNIFAQKEIEKPTNVIAYKDGENYSFEIKNAKENQNVEVEVISDANSNKKVIVNKKINNNSGKKVVSISQNELDNVMVQSPGYSFKLRFVENGQKSDFTNLLHLGKTTIFRNYSPWAYEDLEKASDNKILTSEIASNVSKNVTREELAEIAVKAYEIKYNKTSQGSIKHFKDTDNKYVNMAYDLHIINGNGNGTFNPKGEVTREDYAVVVSNLFKLNNKKKPKIKDSNKIIKYARDSVYASINGKYLSLDENGNFNPKQKMTRQEVISSIVRSF